MTIPIRKHVIPKFRRNFSVNNMIMTSTSRAT
jgi:hypothetical protein